ncbi:hypothetical protein BJY04DRAFT_191518 [Aspergillus karnatakaensis]|uniref:uncharacterized protein n=1 Tax=Aspergillus karnatakaensis TaxID=1810916 RepID=UPI003CCDD36B
MSRDLLESLLLGQGSFAPGIYSITKRVLIDCMWKGYITYNHRVRRTGFPVCSAVLKPYAG